MKAHNTVMIVLAALAFMLIIFAPKLGVGIGFGFFLLICPLMMYLMMRGMGHGDDHKH